MRILMLYPQYKPFGKLNQTSKERDFNLELRLNLSSHQRISQGEQLQNTGPYFKVLNRSGSVARQSRQVFKERERYKTYEYKTDIEGIYFNMYYSRLQVYILVARWLGGSSVEVIQFSGSTARRLVSRDYRATEPPQRIYLENLPCILQLSMLGRPIDLVSACHGFGSHLDDPGWGGTPYQRGGDAFRLAQGCQFRILVSLGVFWAKRHYIQL